MSRIIALFAVLFVSQPAHAHERHHHHHRQHHHHTHHHRARRAPQDDFGGGNVARARARGLPWCGAWMADHFGIGGPRGRYYWVAYNWMRWGHAIGAPIAGAGGVMRHHVFIVVRVIRRGVVLAISGNDSHRVRTRLRSTRGVLGWRYAS